MESKLVPFFLPLCHKGDGLLEMVGASPIFDRNVIDLVAQFVVRRSSFIQYFVRV